MLAISRGSRHWTAAHVQHGIQYIESNRTVYFGMPWCLCARIRACALTYHRFHFMIVFCFCFIEMCIPQTNKATLDRRRRRITRWKRWKEIGYFHFIYILISIYLDRKVWVYFSAVRTSMRPHSIFGFHLCVVSNLPAFLFSLTTFGNGQRPQDARMKLKTKTANLSAIYDTEICKHISFAFIVVAFACLSTIDCRWLLCRTDTMWPNWGSDQCRLVKW